MSRKSEARGGLHHIIPSSRSGGGGDNIFPDERWPSHAYADHGYWHLLFINMRPDEVVRMLKEYINRDGSINEKLFHVRFMVMGPWTDKDENPVIKVIEKIKQSVAGKRRNAWQVLFGDMKVREAIEWIEREFIRKEWLDTPQ